MSYENPEPWTRRKDETPAAWKAFQVYRDGERNMSEISRQLGHRSKSAVQEWALKNDWKNRALAYDRFMDEQRVQEQVKLQREMNERQAKIGQIVQNLSLQGVKNLKPEDLKPSEIARLLEVSSKIERLARELPSEITSNTHDHTIENRPIADLALEWKKRQRKLLEEQARRDKQEE